MNAELRDRLRRLGVYKGTAGLKKRPETGDSTQEESLQSTSSTANTLTPLPTPFGEAFVRCTHYALDHLHGDRALQSALAHQGEIVARLAGNWAAADRAAADRAAARAAPTVDLRDAIFLDTETTGLAGGAGTLVFLVGVGYFSCEDGIRASPDSRSFDKLRTSFPAPDRFVIEQYFLRDPAQEAAMLCALDRLVNRRNAIVTFNGRAFDVPLLETRFTLSRIAPSFGDKVHLDLLPPARRAWRNSLSSCSLSSLEYHLLDVRRDQQDVAGFLIPQLYREYLQSGAGDLNDDMQRVMYHNLHDILSMVTLISRLVDALVQPNSAAEHLAAARYYERLGEPEAAERGYRAALERSMTDDRRLNSYPESLAASQQSSALRRLARFLKRRGKASEALAHWQQLAGMDDVEGLIEVAKYYEWRECDLSQALSCARRASRANISPVLREAIGHRIARLERKLKATNP
jgi:hypothetical protein